MDIAWIQPTTWFGWVFLLLGLVVVAFIVWVWYRTFILPKWDPLRVIPGPHQKAGPTVVGELLNVMREQTAAPQMRWVEEHGKTVMYRTLFNQSRLLTCDPEIVKRVLVTNGKAYKKSKRQLRIMREALGNGLVTSVGTVHTKHRALIKKHFQFHNLKSVFPVFVNAAHRLAHHWETSWADKGNELDVINSMSKFTLDVIGLSAFGYAFNATANPDGPLTRAFGSMLPKLDVWMVIQNLIPPAGAALAAAGIGPYKKRGEAIDLVRQQVADIVSQRIAHLRGNDAGDDTASDRTLLDIMIQDSYKDGSHMTPTELADQTITFLMAGHETTSNALTWTWLLLANHPHVEQRLREEVVAAFPDGSDDAEHFTADSLARMPYLWAVCQESLRMYPPVPITNRVSVEDDVWEVNGKRVRIPKGTPVFVLPYVMHHHPDHWEDPEVFRPERWYTDDELTTRFRPKAYTFMPFLYGERSCIGQRFAVMEMQASLAILIRRFSLRLLPDHKPPRRKLTITMRPTPSLLMTVHSVNKAPPGTAGSPATAPANAPTSQSA